MSVAEDITDPSPLPTGYQKLAKCALEPNLFFEPAMLLPALQHLASPTVRVLAARDKTDGSLAAALPVERLRGRYGPLPTPVPLAAWHHPYSMVGAPLVRAGNLPSALQALLKTAENQTDGAPVLLLRHMLEPGALWPVLLETLENTGRRHAVLQSVERAGLMQSPDAVSKLTLRAIIGQKSNQAANASRRKLSALGELETKTATEGHELESALSTFLTLEDSGWKGNQGTSLRSAGHSDFARNLVHNLSKDRVRIDIMTLTTSDDTVPLAGVLSLRAGNADHPIWMPWKTSYNETYSKMAPGTLILAELTEALLQQAQQAGTGFFLDSLADHNSGIANRLWRDRWTAHDILIDLKPGGGRAFDMILLAERSRLAARNSARNARDRIKAIAKRRQSN